MFYQVHEAQDCDSWPMWLIAIVGVLTLGAVPVLCHSPLSPWCSQRFCDYSLRHSLDSEYFGGCVFLWNLPVKAQLWAGYRVLPHFTDLNQTAVFLWGNHHVPPFLPPPPVWLLCFVAFRVSSWSGIVACQTHTVGFTKCVFSKNVLLRGWVFGFLLNHLTWNTVHKSWVLCWK